VTITRAQLVAHARSAAGTERAEKDWPPDFVLLLADEATEAEWDTLLEEAPHYRTARRTVTLDAAASVALTGAASLDSGSGATIQRAHRPLVVTLNGTEVEYADPWEVDVDGAAAASAGAWWTVSNETLYVAGAANATITVRVNHKPALVTTLADGDTVVWPAGREVILVAALAGRMLEKAGRQSEEARVLLSRGEAARERLLSMLRDRFGGVRRLRPTDRAADWSPDAGGGDWP
jgi:hypothetical protein